MQPIDPFWWALFYASSEVAISSFMRSRSGASKADQGSLRLIWIVVNLSVIGSILARIYLRQANYERTDVVYWIGFALFAFGIALRWYAIAYLGKFFTVDVSVHADHKVIDTGPYKLIRHPSYTGALIAFYGLAFAIANYLTLFFLIVPISAVFLYRIRVEEGALLAGLGEPYRQYMRHTRRLVPFIY